MNNPFSKRICSAVLIVLVLFCRVPPVQAGSDGAREFRVPFATELWIAPLRWDDPSRYHYGPQEFFDMVAWPQTPM